MKRDEARTANNKMARVLVPIPRVDFDPTEVAVSWKVLTQRGHQILFATPDGRPGAGDQIMLDGKGLDPWALAPFLGNVRILGQILRANRDARAAYDEMIASDAFQHPIRWDDASLDPFDGLLLPGGHRARGMREYLESPVLQALVVNAFQDGKAVGAICHGVLLAARSITDQGRSVLYGRKTTALTWSLERSADSLAKIGRPWDRDYYRTYSEEAGQPRGYMSVEQEVTRALMRPEDFIDVPKDAPDYGLKTSGIRRDSQGDRRPAWVVVDGSYVSARWPGDAHQFASIFADLLERELVSSGCASSD